MCVFLDTIPDFPMFVLILRLEQTFYKNIITLPFLMFIRVVFVLLCVQIVAMLHNLILPPDLVEDNPFSFL